MIVVKIELWPMGVEENKREIGRAHIANDISGDLNSGNYWFKLFKSQEYAKNPGIWRKGTVTGFPRRRLGPWDLLYRCLRECVADRNEATR